ncbi:MAG: hypothetical protein WCB68_05880 [Pyrinomonadaceae bacterium]
MKRKISSKLTLFNKVFGLPYILFCLTFCWHEGGFNPFCLIFVPIAIELFWASFRLRRVSIDNEYLYVTNFLKGIFIPLSEIEAVTGGKWYQSPFLTIHLRHPTEFGKKIVFMPGRGKPLFARHPIADELRKLGEEARRKQLLADSSDETSGLAFDDEKQPGDTSAR